MLLLFVYNISLLTTNYFKVSRYNFYLHTLIQNARQLKLHNHIVDSIAKFEGTKFLCVEFLLTASGKLLGYTTDTVWR